MKPILRPWTANLTWSASKWWFREKSPPWPPLCSMVRSTIGPRLPSYADERHRLLIGYLGGRPAGYVTVAELLHPDRPKPEMFLYELEVGHEYRRRGIATALMQRLVQLCHERGCGEMFTLTGEDNDAAQATYRRAGGEAEPAGVMFHWDWPGRR